MIQLNESLFEAYEEEWVEVDAKDVMDSDGFYTTYTWYTNGQKHIFMFGDPDLYGPDEDYADWEIEIYPGNEENAMKEAQEWFDSYKGFDDSEDKEEDMLEEDFSPTLPKWLINYLEKNKNVRAKLSNYKNLDLANMEYIKIPRSEFPSNGFHPLMKDPNKQLVYLIRDNRKNVVYLPGINDDDTSLYIDPDNEYKSINVSGVSKKILLDYAVALGYIDKSLESNFNRDKRLTRSASHRDMVKRGEGQYPYEYTEYPEKEDGSKDYDNPIKLIAWADTKGQDKSGYPLNPTKYKDMLDSADLHTYGKQLERYSKKLSKLRDAIVEAIQTMKLDRSVSKGFGPNLQYAVRYFEDAIKDYAELQKNIERILSYNDLTDEEKNYHIKDEFNATRSYGTVGSLRRDIEKSWEELNAWKENSKAFESNIEEAIDQDAINNAEPNDEMAKLAQRHNIDILNPMEDGDLRVSGTIKDLDAFYREAEELGLLPTPKEEDLTEKFEVKSLDQLKEIGQKLNLKLASEVDEFKKIADEVGLNNEDLDTFIRDEMSEGENGLTAIKRYKQELIDAGVNLSKLKLESLNEGAMKDLDLDLKSGEDFISILKRDLVPLKKKLISLEDNDASEEEIQKIKNDISKVEAKLSYLKEIEK